MKILFTSPAYKPAYRVGGPVIAIASLAESLVQKGHSVTVFTTNCNMSEDLDVPLNCPQRVDGVEVWYFRRAEWLKKALPFVRYISESIGFLYAPAMASQLDRVVPSMDVVHVHNPFIYPTYAGVRAAHIHGKPVFYHQHGALCPDHLGHRSLKKKIYVQFIERHLLQKATGLIALTQYEREGYRNLGLDNHCTIIPNGIDINQYGSDVLGADGLLLDLLPEDIVLLFMGRLHPMKGVDCLLDAFFNIQNEIPNAKLVLAGPDECGLKSRWQERVCQHGLERRVIFPGVISGKLKRNLLARADLFCLLSDAEGFSMSILESLASGTPVMISPGCHFPGVEVAGAGKIVETRSDVMVKAVIELLNDRLLLKEMGKKGRAFVAQNYSWDKIADKLLGTYREGIERYVMRNLA